MKNIKKEFYVFNFLFFLTAFVANAQKDTLSNKFSYHSFSVSPTGLYTGNGAVGISFGGDINFNYGKHIFSVAAGTGAEIVVLGNGDSYQQANILYGREFGLSKRTFVDVSAGAGYFRYDTYDYELGRDIKKKTIGFPISTKFRVMISRRYSMGLKLQANINSAETIATFGIILQWDRKRKW